MAKRKSAARSISAKAKILLLQKELLAHKARIATLERENEALRCEVKQIPHLISTSRELAMLANHDQMTGLFNRWHFFLELEDRLKKAGKMSRAGDVQLNRNALVIFDLVNFKKLNDQFGQSGGDLIIQRMADVFRNQFRKSDLYGRIGGDELMAYLENMPEEKLQEIFTSLNDALSKCDPPLQAYCAYVYCKYGESVDTLYARASKALVDEKKRVRGY